jgi:hypothetical protein
VFPSDEPSVSNEPSLSPSPTVKCDVRDFDDLQGAITGDGDIKLCSGTIIYTKDIDLYACGKQLTFTCPNGDCVLDGVEKFQIFFSRGGNISFDGITFKNGKTEVSPQ